ncbi:hypothetical protein AMTR_s00205p00026120 [Amborella trichopoda]|uniref:NB-ARC domain-containing protein n=2 Tax=Amborella trichopoda TaxID=13333 RepID=W1P5Q8_AMBTC|nr:hypothetical protein AMTR_s00205p00026120 [Amborella trichopoda]
MAMAVIVSRKAMEVGDWIDVLDIIHRTTPNNTSLNGILSTSYNAVRPLLKYCFLYCAWFLEEYKIKKTMLVRLWVAEGFVEAQRGKFEEAAEDCMKELLDRNLIQVHVVVRQLALSIAEKEKFEQVLTYESSTFADKTLHLSIHESNINGVLPNHKLKTRTLLNFGEDILPFTLQTRISKLNFVRDNVSHTSQSDLSRLSSLIVLDFDGVQIERLPKQIRKLIHLRYLGLRNTGILKLPKYLKYLPRLETLDVRGSNLESFPKEISVLQHLTHLLVSRRRNSTEQAINEVPKLYKKLNHDEYMQLNIHVEGWKSLQTLKRATVEGTVVKELSKLIKLKKLCVQVVSEGDGMQIMESIKNMSDLETLSLVDKNSQISLQSMTCPPTGLGQLSVDAVLGELPSWLYSHRHLKTLYLGSSALDVDLLVALQSLPNLARLTLSKAYSGKRMGVGGLNGLEN